MSKATFVDVILPLALPQLYTYAVPFDLVESIQVGHRIIVQFGKKKMYAAIVFAIHHQQPQDYNPKLIESIADDLPVVTQKQLQLWQWIADYYMCTIGEVMSAALPSAMHLSSESVFVFTGVENIDCEKLSNDAQLLAEALQANFELKLPEIQDLLGKKSVYPIVQELMHARICVVKEALQEKYSPKQLTFVELNERYQSEKSLQSLFDSLENKPKQLAVLLHFLQISPQRKPVEKSKLSAQKKLSVSSLNTLIKNEILVARKKTVSRLISDTITVNDLEQLNEQQKRVHHDIQQLFERKDVVVLEGVTGSGKTHVYVQLIKEQIAKGNQTLYLLPEIALTAQIVMRLSNYFGNKVGIYHSKFNEQERVEIYQKVLRNEYNVILSARSGIFLPFQNLGLIIVDEEHERSYKQFDPSPRYHARDVAIIMSKLYQAKTLLGSATISLETHRNVDLEKFGHVQMLERFGDATLPEIKLLNSTELRHQKKMKGLFSDPLIQAINEALTKKEQVIIFQNRRGFANYLNCLTCNWIPYCPNCDVSLTYHKYFDKLVCHYCGFQETKPKSCKACGSKELDVRGVGTEQIEEEANKLFPEAAIARLDLDTTRRKHGHEEVIFAFQQGALDMLIGTQMVTKGLDFDGVSLVGIINADQLISFPDFRAGERAFQLITQVSGRAGRKEKKGKVLIQAGDPTAPVLEMAQNYNQSSFYHHELLNRKQFHFPPYYNLIQVTLKHKDATVVRDASKLLGELLRIKLGRMILGPTTPMIGRIRNQYLKQILIKIEKDSTIITHTKNVLYQAVASCKERFSTIKILIDVDP